LKDLAKEIISFMCFINCTQIIEYDAGHPLYFMLVEPMPCKYKKALVFNSKCSVWMNAFRHTIWCIYAQLNRQRCETHGIAII